MAGEVTVDALPYFDKGYEEGGVRDAAIAMVEEETRRYRPTRNYLSYLPTPNVNAFETDIMKNEFERLSARQPMELLSMRRYELPTPPSGQRNDITAWEECVKNSQAQLQHQEVRIENLELMQEHGCNAWKVYNDQLVAMLQDAQKKLQDIKKKIQEVNWERKTKQIQAGEKLRDLEANWVNLVSKNYEIEEAILKLKMGLAVKGKETTGLTGLAVEAHPREKLKVLCSQLMEALSGMPKTAAYRKYTEKVTQQQLDLVNKVSDIEQLEIALDGGQIEEVIERTKKELLLARRMNIWKPWEPLVSQPPEGQWIWP